MRKFFSARANSTIADNILSAFRKASNILNVDTYYRWNMIIADPDDNKFTDAYVNGNTDFLVTNDTHFNVVKTIKFPKINIVSANEFVKLLEGMNNES